MATRCCVHKTTQFPLYHWLSLWSLYVLVFQRQFFCVLSKCGHFTIKQCCFNQVKCFLSRKADFSSIIFWGEKISILLSSSYSVYVSDGIDLLSRVNDNKHGSHVCTIWVNYSRPLPLLQWNAAISEEAKHQKRHIDSTNAGYFPWLNVEASRCQKTALCQFPRFVILVSHHSVPLSSPLTFSQQCVCLTVWVAFCVR